MQFSVSGWGFCVILFFLSQGKKERPGKTPLAPLGVDAPSPTKKKPSSHLRYFRSNYSRRKSCPKQIRQKDPLPSPKRNVAEVFFIKKPIDEAK